jgi:hypothetical protein
MAGKVPPVSCAVACAAIPEHAATKRNRIIVVKVGKDCWVMMNATPTEQRRRQCSIVKRVDTFLELLRHLRFVEISQIKCSCSFSFPFRYPASDDTDGDQQQRQQTTRANHAVFDPIFIQYIIS